MSKHPHLNDFWGATGSSVPVGPTSVPQFQARQYNTLANWLKMTCPRVEHGEAHFQWRTMVGQLELILAKDNDKFKAGKFRAACMSFKFHDSKSWTG